MLINGIPFETTDKNQYIYNEKTGMVIPYSLCLDREFANKWKFQGVPERSENSENELTEELIRKHLIDNGYGFKQLILSITESCNMRCKYCIYSDEYPLFKTYSQANMDFETAKLAVDYYFENYSKVIRRNPIRKPVIGFYGGEPLLNFSLIRKVIEYTKDNYPDFPTFFNLTTNGTLLYGDVLDYLVKNNVAIAISLDGPKEEHDRNRVLAGGKGTYDIILNNIRAMREKYPEYRYSMIIATYDYKTDLIKTQKFFEENSSELPHLARVQMVMPNFSNYYKQFTDEDIKKYAEQIRDLKIGYYKKMLSGDNDYVGFSDAILGQKFCNYLLKPIGEYTRPSIMPYTGSCIPGEKISVRCNGSIHACERINEHYPIGHIKTGLDFKAIKKIISDYNQKITAGCKHCSIQRLCGLCLAQCAGEETFNKSPPNVCELMKEENKVLMVELYSLLEKKPELYAKFASDYYKKIAEAAGWLEGL